MFTLAILVGIYSYIIFALGLSGFLYKQNVILITFGYILLILILSKSKLRSAIQTVFDFIEKTRITQLFRNRLLYVISLLILLQTIVNVAGALGPELGFDTLWYHLTLPKIYLTNHSILHIPGGLLYYSDMPRLTEMIYVSALAFGNETIAKLIHFSFGILTLFALYLLSRKYFSKTLTLLVVLVFYSNLVVGWQSTTAYVDLARTFFETMSLWGFLNWWKTEDKKWFIESAVMLGLAISTKLLAVGSLLIFSSLIFYLGFKNKIKLLNMATNILVYWYISLLVVLPWLVFAFINTGNPIYPFFSTLYKVGLNFQFINPFIHKSDSISIVYLIIPLALPFLFKKLKTEFRIISLYSLLALAVWYLTPKTDGGRFLLPYLPAFSLLVVCLLSLIKNRLLKNVILSVVICVSLFSLVYRGVANYKYLSVILGKETKNEFLTKHLNFSFGNFYDTDGFFNKNIKKDDVVLLYGFHNLYYVNFPFIDSSWVKKGDEFNYIAVQNGAIPKRFNYWNLIYYNRTTNVRVYSVGRNTWIY